MKYLVLGINLILVLLLCNNVDFFKFYYQAFFAFTVCLNFYYSFIKIKNSIIEQVSLSYFANFILLGVICSIFVVVLLFIGNASKANIGYYFSEITSFPVWMYFITRAFADEVFFKGFIYEYLLKKCGGKEALVITLLLILIYSDVSGNSYSGSLIGGVNLLSYIKYRNLSIVIKSGLIYQVTLFISVQLIIETLI